MFLKTIPYSKSAGGSLVVPISKNKLVHHNNNRRNSTNLMEGSGNLDRLKRELEKLSLKSKKYVKF